MNKDGEDIYKSLFNIFIEYIEIIGECNKECEEQFKDCLTGLNKIIVTNDNELSFFKLYIELLLKLELHNFKDVLKISIELLSIYPTLKETTRDFYYQEYLQIRFYNIILNDDITDYDNVTEQLERLNNEIIKLNKKNNLMKIVLAKINLYLFIFSNNFNTDSKLIDVFNSQDFKYIIDNTASKIICNSSKLPQITHYTSIMNSFKVLESKSFWVSRYDFLNDMSELIYIKTILEKIDVNKITKLNDKEKIFLENQLKIAKKVLSYLFGEITYQKLDENEKEIVEFSNMNYFVLSFSKNNDSLSMWGNYSKFNGCNINFTSSDLMNFYNRKHQGNLLNYMKGESSSNINQEIFSSFYFGDVVYDEDAIKENLINDLIEAVEIHKKYVNIIKEITLTSIIVESILIRGLFSKQNHFKYEEEYRFVFSLSKELYQKRVNFRSNDEHFVPYIEIPINLDSINKIIVAPKNNSDLAVKGFKEYNNINNLKFNVDNSTIKFR